MDALSSLVFAVLFSAPSVPPGAELPIVPGVKIIAPEDRKSARLYSEPLELEAEAGDDEQVDATKLIVSFLAAAKEKEAVAVSGLELHVVTTLDGVAVDCVTLVGPEQEVAYRLRHTSGHFETVRVPRLVTRTEPLWKKVCRTQTDYSWSASGGGSRLTTSCTMEHVPTRVTRFEYQWQTRWVPPRMDAIGEAYSRWTLVESKPRCVATPTDEDGHPLGVSGIRGQIHRRSGRRF